MLRTVRADASAQVRALLESKALTTNIANGKVVETWVVEPGTVRGMFGSHLRPEELVGTGLLLEHAVVPFPSHPAEWPSEMLLAAGLLTLDLAGSALHSGYGLKDATPLNVLFRGPTPVFVDVLSFEKRDPLDPTWRPYAQFVRTFLLPLLAHRYAGMALRDVFLSRRDGLEPTELLPAMRGLVRLQPAVFTHVVLANWLSRLPSADSAGSRIRRETDPAKAGFILNWNLRRLRKVLEKHASRRHSTPWSTYDEVNSYTAEAVAAKEAFVRRAVQSRAPEWILDVGANRGRHSIVAAEAGARVVSIDTDPVVIGRLWAEAAVRKLDILPLIVDFARPTPGLGWRNDEFPSFLQRAQGRFQGVLLLAVLHHLLVTEGIPLREVLRVCTELASNFAVVEFVPPHDPMFRKIARGRDDLYTWLTRASFEKTCLEFYEIAQSVDLPGSDRCLYALSRPPR
jgi:hypothetical protein